MARLLALVFASAITHGVAKRDEDREFCSDSMVSESPSQNATEPEALFGAGPNQGELAAIRSHPLSSKLQTEAEDASSSAELKICKNKGEENGGWNCEGWSRPLKDGQECKLRCTGAEMLAIDEAVKCEDGKYKSIAGVLNDDGNALCVDGKITVTQDCQTKFKNAEEVEVCVDKASMAACTNCQRDCLHKGKNWHCAGDWWGKESMNLKSGETCNLECDRVDEYDMDPVGAKLTCENGKFRGKHGLYVPHESQLCIHPDESDNMCRYKGDGWYCSGRFKKWTENLEEGDTCRLKCVAEDNEGRTPVESSLKCEGGEFRGELGTYAPKLKELCPDPIPGQWGGASTIGRPFMLLVPALTAALSSPSLLSMF